MDEMIRIKTTLPLEIDGTKQPAGHEFSVPAAEAETLIAQCRATAVEPDHGTDQVTEAWPDAVQPTAVINQPDAAHDLLPEPHEADPA